jgi:hypothetical protein
MGSPPGDFNYGVFLIYGLTLSEFQPTYSTATNSFNGAAAAPAVFSGYVGTVPFEASLTMSVVSGSLILAYDPTVGVSASVSSVSAVPEPASHIVLLLGLSGAGIALVRRRRAAALA